MAAVSDADRSLTTCRLLPHVMNEVANTALKAINKVISILKVSITSISHLLNETLVGYTVLLPR